MISIIAAAVLQAASPWDSVTLDGWVYQGGTDAVSMFTRPAIGTGRRLWVRYEYLPGGSGENGIRSIRILQEFDCSGARARTLQHEEFAGNNLAGDGWQRAAGDWTYVAPGTFAEALLELACDG